MKNVYDVYYRPYFGKNQKVTRYFITQYNEKYFRVTVQKCVRNPKYDFKKSLIKNKTPPDELLRISLSRSKREIRELCFCNPFTYFSTITINSEFCDRFHLQECQDLLRKKLKKLKRNNKDFIYLFITEKHKNGAFHFHGLINDIPFYTNSNGYLSNTVFDEIGFNSFSKIKDFNKCCNYMTKYITKDCVKNENNQIYIRSKNLKFADKYEVTQKYLEDYPYFFNKKYENDFIINYDCYNDSENFIKDFKEGLLKKSDSKEWNDLER